MLSAPARLWGGVHGGGHRKSPPSRAAVRLPLCAAGVGPAVRLSAGHRPPV